MADVEFSHAAGAYAPTSDQQGGAQSLVTATNIAGAVVSLALIAGVGVWGYKLMIRDVTGIPVVRAFEGEIRVRPENPGGQLAQNQGLAVNAIAADGVAEGPVDQVILAPPAIQLSDEDTPVRAPEPVEVAANSVEETDEAAKLSQQEQIDALVAELTDGAQPLVQVAGAKTVQAPTSASATPQAETTAASLTDVAEPQPAVFEVTRVASPKVPASLRPRIRPANVPAVVQNAAYTPAQPTAEIDPDKIPSGTRLVQLGAFESADVARQEWARLEGRFGVYMQDKSRVIQLAQSNGRSFYRLRAMGFVDLNDARRFCSAFKAEGADCIPVQVR